MPWAPDFPGEALEPSWQIALNNAAAQNRRFGSEIVFTFGPFSASYTRAYYPGIYATALLVNALVAFFLVYEYSRRAALRGRSIYLLLIWAGAIALLSFFYLKDAIFFVACWLAADTLRIRLEERRYDFDFLFSLSILATLSLVKSSFALASIALLFLIFFLLRKRNFSYIVALASYVTIVAGLWCMSGQRLLDLSGHVAGTLEMVGGYSEAMAVAGRVQTTVLFVACALFSLGVIYARSRLKGVLVLGLMFALVFKSAFVRQDIHEVIAAGFLILVSLVLIAEKVSQASVFAFFASLMFSVGVYQEQVRLPAGVFFGEARTQVARSASAILALISDPDAHKKKFIASLAEIASHQPLPRVVGRVDTYSLHQTQVIANGLTASFRPLPQSYSAYTPSLARRNAEFLRGPRHPEHIFFRVEPIDGRNSAMEDGLSWPVILAEYDLAGVAGEALHFSRSLRPRQEQFHFLAEQRILLGEAASIPSTGGLIWAEIEIKRTLFGRLLGLIYRLPELSLSVQANDGRWRTSKYIAAIGGAGFLISPQIVTTTDFGELAREVELRGSSIARERAIRLNCLGRTCGAFEEYAMIRYSELKILQP